ncbi:DMT family transporter [Patescibacteria group bacterium]
MRKKYYAFLVALAAIMWSLGALLRRQLYSIPPATIVLYEHIISFLLVAPWFPKFFKEYKKMNKKDWGVMLLIALVGGTLGTFFFTSALVMVENISYSLVVLLQQTQPIFAVILAVLLLKEKINKKFSLLAIIGLTAAYFLTFPDYKPVILGNGEELKAAGLALAAAASWGATTVFGRIMIKKLSYIALASLRFLIVIPSVFILSLILNQTYPITAITASQWWQMIAIAFVARTASIVIYYKGLQYTEAKVATFAELTNPVGAIIIGYFFLNEKLTSIQWLSAFVLLAAIVVLSTTSPKQLEE